MRSNSLTPLPRLPHLLRSLAPVCWLLLDSASASIACPFCTPVGPSLASQRDSADIVLLAEVTASDASQCVVTPRHVFKGVDALRPWLADRAKRHSDEQLAIPSLQDNAIQPRDLLLLFAQLPRSPEQSSPNWTHSKVNELSAAYFARAPSLREPSSARLKYFARYLEHADSLVADDAYREFAAAPYDVVAQAKAAIPMAKVRSWLSSEMVPDARKGLYGLLLGLAAAPDRDASLRLLEQLFDQQARLHIQDAGGRDFRAGFDGILGGYLALSGPAALDRIDRTLLRDDDAAEGNLRHAVTALRFAYEFLPQIPRDRLCASMRLLLRRPSFAPQAITDLARWHDLRALDQIVSLYDKSSPQQASIRQAVVGYLLAIDQKQSSDALALLRARDPSGVKAAEEKVTRFPAFGAAGRVP